jgi:hypothetical protein
MISADGDKFVRYSSDFTVTKGLMLNLSDTAEIYQRQIRVQSLLAERGLAPRILRKDIVEGNFITWVMEDAGLPIEQSDEDEANRLLDTLYDMGINYSWTIHQSHFLRGFDKKLRIIDFQHTEQEDKPITTSQRIYLKWKAS